MASKGSKRLLGRKTGQKTAKRASAEARKTVKRPKGAAPNAKPESRAKPAARPLERASVATDPPKVAPAPRLTCPVVGIGASAGGLEAAQRFLSVVPPDSGLAYVLVQHLDPTHKGMFAELLQHATKMPVVEAKDRLPIAPDHVYVIPPNKDMSLLHGVLHLLPRVPARGLNLPVDFFFRSLAEDQQERSIGVVLSGMGADGTLGLRDIKEKGGAAFVQAPSSAKFDGMPRSAIDADVADVIAAVEELPGKILDYLNHVPFLTRPERTPIDDKALGTLDKIFVLLRSQTGNDFSLYKKSTIHRRIERRMGLHQVDGIANYVRFLRENPREIELLFKELLIGVTSFFRDSAAWDYLQHEVMPGLFASRPGGALRAWVPACSTGEEAYSLAMAFKEAVEPFKPVKNFSLQIFATDLDRDAVEKARQGFFPESIAADVPPERLRRFFVKEERGYRVSKEIREMVVFAPQNVISDPPFTRLDILCCRNLLIYFSSELQKKLIPLFHYSLNPGGVLFLGSAETIGSFSGMFSSIDPKARLYRRTTQPMAPVPVEFPSSAPGIVSSAQGASETEQVATPAKPSSVNLQVLADRMLVQRFSPVSVLCSEKGDVLYISRRAGKYLEPAVGKANLNIFAMAREGLRFELSRAFASALREDRLVTVRGIEMGVNGSAQVLDLHVQKLSEPKELAGTVVIVFRDVEGKHETPPRRLKRGNAHAREMELEHELQRVREEVQTAREEMQTSQEELKSTNEELQSTNEELQSTNEELTTSKEEMQSLNEELQTVNQELQAKVDELSRSNNDMKNLLNSTDIATLFLDGDLHVRRFTTPTARIIKLIPSDIGRPITDIASELDYPELADDAREVLCTLIFKEKDVKTRDGRWVAVRIMPYRTLENVIDGVVITFTDVRPNRALEAALRQESEQLRGTLARLLDVSRDGFVELDENLTVTALNAAAEALLNRRREDVIGKSFWGAIPELRGSVVDELVDQVLREQAPVVLDDPPSNLSRRGILSGCARIRIYPHREGGGVSLFLERAP